MPHFLSPLLRSPDAAHLLRNERTGQTIATAIEPAFESAARRRGLLGRDAMRPGSALVIAPCSSVHTWFMRFPIDIVFAARDGRVLKVRRHVAPWRLAGAMGAFAVIELPGGSLDASALVAGDALQIVSA